MYDPVSSGAPIIVCYDSCYREHGGSVMNVLGANLQRKKPPSRIKYEKLNPLFSFRLPKDRHQKLKEYARKRGGSISNYFRQLIDRRERLIAMAIETLRKFYGLGAEDVDKLCKMCGISLDTIKKVKSFEDKGFGYIIEAPHANIRLDVARCFSYLVLRKIAELDIKFMASLLKEDAKVVELGISLARSELLELFKTILLRKMLKNDHFMLISDTLSSILWILLENNEVVLERGIIKLREEFRKACKDIEEIVKRLKQGKT